MKRKKFTVLIFIIVMLMPLITVFSQINATVNHEEVNPKKYLPDNAEIETVKYANITSTYFKDIIVEGHFDDTTYRGIHVDRMAYAALIAYDPKARDRKNIYVYTTPNRGVEVITGQMSPHEREFAIFADWGGMGSFMDYTVVGYINSELKMLLKREALGHGKVEIQGGQIIECEEDCAVAYSWNGKYLVGVQLNMEPIPPLSPSDQIVQYRVGEDGSMMVDYRQKEIQLPVGDKIVFQRIGCDRPWYLQFSCDWEILELKPGDGIYGKKPGTTLLEVNAKYAELGARIDTIVVKVIEPTTNGH